MYLSFDSEQLAKDWRKSLIQVIGNIVLETEDSMMMGRTRHQGSGEPHSEYEKQIMQQNETLQSFFDPADMFKKQYGDLCDLKPGKPSKDQASIEEPLRLS